MVTHAPVLCPQCKTTLVNLVPFGHGFLTPTCDPCCEKIRQAEDKVNPHKIREARWLEICPLIYRETNLNHASLSANLEAIAKVVGWEPDIKGMLLVGPSGRGKTRATWLLLHKLHFLGQKFIATTETDFAHDIGRTFGEGASEGVAYIDKLIATPLLVIDDLGKSVSTQRFAQELYHVVEKRTCHGRPIIASLNSSSHEYEEKLGDVGSPVIRRLREFCSAVKFT